MNRTASTVEIPTALSRVLVWLLVLILGLVSSCGYIRPVPKGFHPEKYAPVTISQLKAPRKAGLAPGQRVYVEGYFWQYLDYDPVMVPSYVTMASHPVAWSRLRWASLYQQPQMRGYYDRLALTRQQQEDWRLKRLEHLRVYGQLAPLGFGVLYLQAHHLERLDAAEDSLSQRDEAPVLEETPTL
jgi:hypothetical protein